MPVIKRILFKVIVAGLTASFVFTLSTWVNPVRAAQNETRALWANAVEEKGHIDWAVDRLIDANMNVLLYRAYGNGTVYFDMNKIYNETNFFKGPEFSISRDILPFRTESWVNIDSVYGKDALRYIIDRRNTLRSQGRYFEVHLFVGINEGGQYDYSPGQTWPYPSTIRDYMLFADGHHPEFKKVFYGNQGKDHQYGCIDQPMYQHWLVSMLAGVTQAYDIDGIHLDYVRSLGVCFDKASHDYPEGADGTSWDYPGGSVQAYANWTKNRYGVARSLETDAPWGTIKSYTSGGKYFFDPEALRAVSQWEQYNVDKLVEAVSREVRKVKPGVKVTAAINQKQPWLHCLEINPNETDCTGKYNGHHAPQAGFTSDDGSTADDLGAASKDIVNGQSAWKWLVNGWLDAAFPFVYTNYAQNNNAVYASNKLMRAATGEYAKAKGFSAFAADAFAQRMFAGIETYNVDQSPTVADDGSSIGGQIKDLRSRLNNKGIALFDSKYHDSEHVDHFSAAAASYLGLPINGVYPQQVMPEWFTSPTPTTHNASPTTNQTSCPSNPARLICFEAWRRAYTTSTYSTDADLNNDGNVTLSDYEVWRRAYTSSPLANCSGLLNRG